MRSRTMLARALMASVSVVAVAMAGLTLLLVIDQRRAFEGRLEARAGSVARMVSARCGPAMRAGDREELRRILARALTGENITSVALLDAAGNVVAETRREDSAAFPYEIIRPVETPGAAGAVHVRFSTANQRALLARTARHAGAMAAVGTSNGCWRRSKN